MGTYSVPPRLRITHQITVTASLNEQEGSATNIPAVLAGSHVSFTIQDSHAIC
jgi:hypothetical protein